MESAIQFAVQILVLVCVIVLIICVIGLAIRLIGLIFEPIAEYKRKRYFTSKRKGRFIAKLRNAFKPKREGP